MELQEIKDKVIALKISSMSEHYNKACTLAYEVVEVMARDILLKHDELEEFIMSMGSYFFTYKDRPDDILQPYTQKMGPNYRFYTYHSEYFLAPLNSFIEEWGDVLKIQGEPMRFTATGAKLTEWN